MLFRSLENYKQVVLLVPTTILAEQHFKTILKRFSTFPYQVVCLSRFQSKVEQQAILKRVKCQQVDMIIGTHRLLQKDVTFKDLGLVIVDEEQRFGVKDKEKLKTFVATVDVLSVSATPIPRTMYMALTGTRDFSVIGTPPKMKKEVRTVLGPFDEQAVKQAILKEKNRKGQVFYVHNRVDSILSIQSRLSVLLPETTIDVVHGQLPELEIQRRLQAFYAHKTDVLIATTIIENGIDFPNANTLIIDQAEQLGVSQIHQLRGRVGRSNTQGLAYIFYSPSKTLTEKSKARLQAIKEYASLGSGYQLAVKDLEIRGAGNLLGREQSGHVLTVGFNLYCHLLEAAIFRAKGEERRTQGWLNIPAQEFFVEDTYIASDRERLAVYQRVQTLQCLEDCSKLQSELEDRYGVMSIAMKGRFSRVEERLKAK